ncbi:response regulator [Sphingomonas sp. QA11]|uniref:response regulator n=1 Tax=Sphingomonas sp. QA11 TaxID=2950605 RepID=UPI00234B87F9|nr:response regulator [Sphingomonas sp. QA11]WCM25966.1 response regulator [Sphingomonas sp. QA11]
MMAQGRKTGLSTEPYVLVVDDNPLILMTVCDILEDAGFRYYDAENGDNAKAMLPQFGPNITLLFTDVEMPGNIDGFALAHHVAKEWPDIEIVVASGRITPQPGDMPDKATFVGKPFTAEMICDHLRDKLPDGKLPAQLKNTV